MKNKRPHVGQIILEKEKGKTDKVDCDEPFDKGNLLFIPVCLVSLLSQVPDHPVPIDHGESHAETVKDTKDDEIEGCPVPDTGYKERNKDTPVLGSIQMPF